MPFQTTPSVEERAFRLLRDAYRETSGDYILDPHHASRSADLVLSRLANEPDDIYDAVTRRLQSDLEWEQGLPARVEESQRAAIRGAGPMQHAGMAFQEGAQRFLETMPFGVGTGARDLVIRGGEALGAYEPGEVQRQQRQRELYREEYPTEAGVAHGIGSGAGFLASYGGTSGMFRGASRLLAPKAVEKAAQIGLAGGKPGLGLRATIGLAEQAPQIAALGATRGESDEQRALREERDDLYRQASDAQRNGQTYEADRLRMRAAEINALMPGLFSGPGDSTLSQIASGKIPSEFIGIAPFALAGGVANKALQKVIPATARLSPHAQGRITAPILGGAFGSTEGETLKERAAHALGGALGFSLGHEMLGIPSIRGAKGPPGAALEGGAPAEVRPTEPPQPSAPLETMEIPPAGVEVPGGRPGEPVRAAGEPRGGGGGGAAPAAEPGGGGPGVQSAGVGPAARVAAERGHVALPREEHLLPDVDAFRPSPEFSASIAEATGREPWPHQLENLARIRAARAQGNGALITDGTGTGKSFTGAMAVRDVLTNENPAARTLLVVPNREIYDQWEAEFAALHVPSELSTGRGIPEVPQGRVTAITTRRLGDLIAKRGPEVDTSQVDALAQTADLVLMDEPQAFKHLETGRRRAIAGERLGKGHGQALYFTATPAEEALHLGYLSGLNAWGRGRGGWQEYLGRFGIRPDPIRGWRGVRPESFQAIHDDLVQRGVMFGHDQNLGRLSDVNLSFSPPSPELTYDRDRIVSAFDRLDAAYGSRVPAFRRVSGGIRHMILQSMMEQARVPDAVRIGRDMLEKGYQVVFTVNRRNGTSAEQWWSEYLEGGKGGRQWGEAMRLIGETLREEGFALTSPVDLLRQQFPDSAIISGETPSGSKARRNAIDRFNDGTAQTAILTIPSGGTGLSLGDAHPNARPRAQVNISVPDTGMALQQLLGRTVRGNNRGRTQQFFLFTDLPEHHAMAAKTASRARSMNAIVRGQVSEATADQMRNWDFAPVAEETLREIRPAAEGVGPGGAPGMEPESQGLRPAAGPPLPEAVDLPSQIRSLREQAEAGPEPLSDRALKTAIDRGELHPKAVQAYRTLQAKGATPEYADRFFREVETLSRRGDLSPEEAVDTAFFKLEHPDSAMHARDDVDRIAMPSAPEVTLEDGTVVAVGPARLPEARWFEDKVRLKALRKYDFENTLWSRALSERPGDKVLSELAEARVDEDGYLHVSHEVGEWLSKAMPDLVRPAQGAKLGSLGVQGIEDIAIPWVRAWYTEKVVEPAERGMAALRELFLRLPYSRNFVSDQGVPRYVLDKIKGEHGHFQALMDQVERHVTTLEAEGAGTGFDVKAKDIIERGDPIPPDWTQAQQDAARFARHSLAELGGELVQRGWLPMQSFQRFIDPVTGQFTYVPHLFSEQQYGREFVSNVVQQTGMRYVDQLSTGPIRRIVGSRLRPRTGAEGEYPGLGLPLAVGVKEEAAAVRTLRIFDFIRNNAFGKDPDARLRPYVLSRSDLPGDQFPTFAPPTLKTKAGLELNAKDYSRWKPRSDEEADILDRMGFNYKDVMLRKDILGELRQVLDIPTKGRRFFRRWGQAIRKGLVVYNIKTGLPLQTMGNFIMQHVGGAPMYELPIHVKNLVDFWERGPLYQRVRDNGGFASTFFEQVIQNRGEFELFKRQAADFSKEGIEERPEMLFDMLERLVRGIGIGHLKPFEIAERLFPMLDQWAIMNIAEANVRRNGMGWEKAVDYARSWYDYQRIGPFWRGARESGLWFVTFPYLIARKYPEAIRHPLRWLTAGAAIPAMQYALRQGLGIGDDEWEQVVKNHTTPAERVGSWVPGISEMRKAAERYFIVPLGRNDQGQLLTLNLFHAFPLLAPLEYLESAGAVGRTNPFVSTMFEVMNRTAEELAGRPQFEGPATFYTRIFGPLAGFPPTLTYYAVKTAQEMGLGGTEALQNRTFYGQPPTPGLTAAQAVLPGSLRQHPQYQEGEMAPGQASRELREGAAEGRFQTMPTYFANPEAGAGARAEVAGLEQQREKDSAFSKLERLQVGGAINKQAVHDEFQDPARMEQFLGNLEGPKAVEGLYLMYAGGLQVPPVLQARTFARVVADAMSEGDDGLYRSTLEEANAWGWNPRYIEKEAGQIAQEREGVEERRDMRALAREFLETQDPELGKFLATNLDAIPQPFRDAILYHPAMR